MSAKLFVLLVLAAVEIAGSAAKPGLTFRPNYSPIFKGEKIRMFCDSQPKEKDFGWVLNNVHIYQGEVYEIVRAESRHSGSYQCQTKDGSRSEMVTLNVTEGRLILQVPPYIHEGDRLFLNCHHDPKLQATQSIFHKGNIVARDWNDEYLFSTPDINMNASGLYSCTKRFLQDSKTVTYSASASIRVKELFTTPQIQVTRNAPEGSLILTCNTKISLYKPKTELWYGFYKGKENIKEFTPANQFKVPAIEQKKSGKYSCAARPKTSSVTKTSSLISKASLTHNIAGLALFQSVLIISSLFIFIT